MESETLQFIRITILLAIISLCGTILVIFRFYQISFLLELTGLIGVVTYFIKSREATPYHPLKEMMGITTRSMWFLLLLAVVLSIPFWLSECFKVGSVLVYRRAFGTYSYSTLIKAPIFEEIYFRGILMSVLIKRFKPHKAIVYNGLLFTLIHLQLLFVIFNITVLLVFLSIFLLGVSLAYVQYKSNNLHFVIILHFATNLMLILFGSPFDPIIANNSC